MGKGGRGEAGVVLRWLIDELCSGGRGWEGGGFSPEMTGRAGQCGSGGE